MKIFFSSDHHFNHQNIIKYCNRPFKDIQEMDEVLIQNWNRIIKNGDSVYYLGDFGFAHADYLDRVLRRLNGQKFLVLGNHDREIKRDKHLQSNFAWVKDYYELKHFDTKVILSHYPFLSWNGMHRNTWHLHGHCHGSLPVEQTKKRQDIGVDCFNYTPVSFDEIKVIMDTRIFEPVDHHVKDE